MSPRESSGKNSNKVVKTLFNQQQDFIVVGLCGKTGSGVSTVAQILRQDFEDLNLCPTPPKNLSDYGRHEYSILYNYAQKNWSGFYLIKTRALIVARVLLYGEDQFVQFLTRLAHPEHATVTNANELGYSGAHTTQETENIKEAVQEFFEKKMVFSIEKQFYTTMDQPIKLKDFLAIDRDTLASQKLIVNAKGKTGGKPIVSVPIEETVIEYQDPKHPEKADPERITVYPVVEKEGTQGTSQTQSIAITNRDLYKLFRYYQHCRQSKRGNLNPVYYWILQEYIFDFLPQQVDLFWKNIKKNEGYQKIETVAMQLIGNNLRISDEPYDNKANGDSYPFKEDAYTTIAKDINHSIKILRAYLSKKTELKGKIHAGEQMNEAELDVTCGKPIHTHALAVIDSIKNPFESMYLKQRYSNYYLIGVYTDEDQRQKRLINSKKFSVPDIKAIDQVEQLPEFRKNFEGLNKTHSESNPGENGAVVHETSVIIRNLCERIKKEHLELVIPFIVQNVSSCLESADIFINNSNDNDSYLNLKQTLIRYISLMMNPGLVLPTDVERCMQTAYVSKVNSGCISRQVGAVVTDSEYHLLSVGWNQQPPEQLPCLYRDLCELSGHFDTEGYSDYENFDTGGKPIHGVIRQLVQEEYGSKDCALKVAGKHVPFCFKDIYNKVDGTKNQVHTRSLHAEETAFLNLSGGNKDAVRGGCLFTTSSPCVLCAKKAKYLGISKIYYVDPYPDISLSHILMAGPMNTRPEFILFTGAIGTAYTRLFTPLLPIKDEHELWMGHKMMSSSKPDGNNKEDTDQGKEDVPHG